MNKPGLPLTASLKEFGSELNLYPDFTNSKAHPISV